jgi:beta-xylosidase
MKTTNLHKGIIIGLTFLLTFSGIAGAKRITDINIRDPFIYACEKNHTYYMYASNTVDGLGGVEVYTSKDLVEWSDPVQVFTVQPTNRLTGKVWAPEMHYYKGKYYLFLTLNCPYAWKHEEDGSGIYNYRSVQTFWSKSPEGPFHAFSDMTLTPIDEMALDGTLYVEDKVPYLVYCNEWVQRKDGTVRLARLSKDLSKIVSRPVDLFCASAAPWATAVAHDKQGFPEYVTDGCFLFKGRSSLFMTWSSFQNGIYAVGIARSATGKITGPWIQSDEALACDNGGHAMIFTDFEGRLRIVYHRPNSPRGAERAVIRYVEDLGDTLRIVDE